MRNCFQSTLTQRLAKIISFTCRDTALGLHRVAVSVEDEVWSLALRGTAKVGEGSSRSCRANPMPENPAGGSACGVVLHRTLPQGPRPHDAVLPQPALPLQAPLCSLVYPSSSAAEPGVLKPMFSFLGVCHVPSVLASTALALDSLCL